MADAGRGKTFVDTNVFVYAVDASDAAKRERALQVLRTLGDSVVVSAQILNEFYVVTTRRLPEPLSEEEAAAAVERLAGFPVVAVDASLVRDGIALARRASLSLWDALVVHAAIAGGCTRLLSEDLQHGQTFGPVRVENPFVDL